VLHERYGGLWQREVLVQGKPGLGKSANRIGVPLRLTWQPSGELGCCQRSSTALGHRGAFGTGQITSKDTWGRLSANLSPSEYAP
jgi:hypothetical protein